MSRETEQLAAFVADLRFEDLPEDVAVTAKLAIRDIVGVALFASHLPWSQMVAEHAHEVGSGRSSVWGTPWRTSATQAALANGTAAHGIEMDDRSHDLDMHPGAAIVPAAVALAEHLGVNGRDLILAVVCGYEVAFRVAQATKGAIDRFYWSSIRNVWGAAAASGKILGLDRQGLQYTLGIVGNMASGLSEQAHDPHGNMIKRLHGGGWPAQSGVTAGQLAARGFTAPGTILEGKYGLRSFCTVKEPDLAALTRDLGADFRMRHWETKTYATRGGYSSSVDAIRQLRTEHGIQPEQVRHIAVGCAQKILQGANLGAPVSIMSAQANLPFTVAAAFYYDFGDPGIWTEAILQDARVASLLAHTELHVDPEIDAICQATNDHGGARIAIDLADGRQVSTWVRHARGTPANPLTPADIEQKFRTLAGRVLPPEQLATLLAALDHLDEGTSPIDLSALTLLTVAAGDER